MGGLREHLAEPHVTDLRRELLELTKTRADAIGLCLQWMDEINQDYDQRATELNRQIRRLEGAQPVEPAVQPARPRRVRTRTVNLEGTEGWTPEEIQYFKELVTK